VLELRSEEKERRKILPQVKPIGADSNR